MEPSFPVSTTNLFLKKYTFQSAALPLPHSPWHTYFEGILTIHCKPDFMRESEMNLWDESDTVFAPKELTKP